MKIVTAKEIVEKVLYEKETQNINKMEAIFCEEKHDGLRKYCTDVCRKFFPTVSNNILQHAGNILARKIYMENFFKDDQTKSKWLL